MGPFQKVSLRTEAHTLIVNPDAHAFQTTGAHERRRLNRKYKKKLRSVPQEELYLRTQIEAPSENRLSLEPRVAGTLRTLLLELEQAHPRRVPTNRSSKDVMVLGDGTVVPTVSEGVEVQLSEGMEAQLKALGYVDD
jgi:hypothetical protein